MSSRLTLSGYSHLQLFNFQRVTSASNQISGNYFIYFSRFVHLKITLNDYPVKASEFWSLTRSAYQTMEE